MNFIRTTEAWSGAKKHYLFASDFDQTLSYSDSGYVLSDMLGISNFEERVSKISKLNLVQQGGELAYLLLHDPDFRVVRREHLLEAGKQVRLKKDIESLKRFLSTDVEGFAFSFFVISAAPQEVIQSALEGIVPPEQIFGSRFAYSENTGEITSLLRVPAGYGKVAALESIKEQLGTADDRVIYAGDGSSDIHVMLHVNQRDGFTISVSEAKHIAQIARRTVLSDTALAVLVPILEDICGWESPRIRSYFESQGQVIREWTRMRTDWLTIGTPTEGQAARRALAEA